MLEYIFPTPMYRLNKPQIHWCSVQAFSVLVMTGLDPCLYESSFTRYLYVMSSALLTPKLNAMSLKKPWDLLRNNVLAFFVYFLYNF